MPLNSFEEFDLSLEKRRASRKEFKQETRRQRREAMRRLERYVRELSTYPPQFPVGCYELSARLD